jgi:hypothetical protein
VALGELRQTIRINDDGTGRVDLANSTWATSGCPLRGARAHGATPTLAVFAQALGTVPFDPAQHRIFIRFVDGQGITRGATSAAVRTE